MTVGKGVWVITGIELGWDCVVEVIACETCSAEDIERRYPDGGTYVVTHKIVQAQPFEQ